MVYRARSNRGNKTYALKRMAVNNEQDLYLARQEIAITVSGSCTAHIDSSRLHAWLNIRNPLCMCHENLTFF